jgi:CheY-like chemotaxis protein
LRNNPATAETPVVIVTAQVLDEAQRQELASGAQAVLSKEALARAESLEIQLGPPVLVRPRYSHADMPGERPA